VLHVLIDNWKLSGRVTMQLLKVRAIIACVDAVRNDVRSTNVELKSERTRSCDCE